MERDQRAGIQFISRSLSAAGVSVKAMSVQHFASLLMLQQAITSIGAGEMTSSSVLKALQTTIKNYTMGDYTGATSYRAGAQAQGPCTGGVSIKNGAWVPVNGGGLQCRKGAPAPLP